MCRTRRRYSIHIPISAKSSFSQSYGAIKTFSWWNAGHLHRNTITAQPPQAPSPYVGNPENGFWEVETPSLRDFPRQFRRIDIYRNSDNNISHLRDRCRSRGQPGAPVETDRNRLPWKGARLCDRSPADIPKHGPVAGASY